MEEPTILAHAPDAVDVRVDDLESITMTRAEYEANLKRAEERGKNRAWAESRKHYQAKGTKAEDRLSKIERLVALLAGHMFPGLSVPASNAEKENQV